LGVESPSQNENQAKKSKTENRAPLRGSGHNLELEHFSKVSVNEQDQKRKRTTTQSSDRLQFQALTRRKTLEMRPFLSSSSPSQRPAGGKQLIKLVVAILVLLANHVPSTNAQSLTETAKTAKLIRDWSTLLGDMIASSFGFLSPPGCARAFSMLMTAEW
jgi:hypothetical protein